MIIDSNGQPSNNNNKRRMSRDPVSLVGLIFGNLDDGTLDEVCASRMCRQECLRGEVNGEKEQVK